jgi:predicted TIM-barrel fold metal-dependent hydrolase
LKRRTFLLASLASAQNPPIPVIDTHIHLFDVSRPQGVPWPPKENTVLYKTALPDRYRKLATEFGIVGAIEIEASPWLEDNQWVLDVAAKDEILVGTVGDIEPGTPDFRKHLDRFHRNPLFRGIRYGNLWPRDGHTDDLDKMIDRREFVADLKALDGAGLVLDSANPNPRLIHGLLRASDAVPNLRIVIDHLPKLEIPTDAAAKKAYYADLHELGKRPQVFVKISSVLRNVNGRVPEDLGFYRGLLDELWGIFGEDRVLYGSDWPNSDSLAEYPHIFRIVHEYVATKPREAQEKYFWRNSRAAYKWIKRDPAQPG